MNKGQQITDHEAILLITQKVDTIHQEMKDGFANLQNNYASRMDTLESKQEEVEKVYLAKDVQDKLNVANENRFEVDEERINNLENWRSYIAGGLAVVTILLALCAWVYNSQQSVQDDRINNLIKQVNKI